MPDRREFLKGTATVAIGGLFPAFAAGRETMPTRPVPGTDERISIVGMGNSQAFRAGDADLSRQLIDMFLDHGGGYVDTSGDARVTVGNIVREREAGAELFIGSYLEGRTPEALRADVSKLTKVQGGGPLDLGLSNDPARFAEFADAFRALREDGLVRFVGVARSGKAHFPAIRKLIESGSVDVVQVNYSMLEPEAADEVLPSAQDAGVAVVINRPFINGRYFSLVSGQDLPAWAADFDCESWAQFSLKFILAHPAVTCVLTETTNPRHLADNLGAAYGRLPDEAVQQAMLGVMRKLAG